MKNLWTSLFICLMAFGAIGQNDSIYDVINGDTVYENPEVLPVFGDCSKVLKRNKPNLKELLEACSQKNIFEFLAKNMNYPETARNNGESGTVYIEFIVDSKGELGNIGLLKDVDGGEALNIEALRIIHLLANRNSGEHNWKPGEHKGKKVSTHFVIPIRFALK